MHLDIKERIIISTVMDLYSMAFLGYAYFINHCCCSYSDNYHCQTSIQINKNEIPQKAQPEAQGSSRIPNIPNINFQLPSFI
jgi:hypothetical protein